MKRGGPVSRRINQKTRNGDQVKQAMENLYHQIKKSPQELFPGDPRNDRSKDYLRRNQHHPV